VENLPPPPGIISSIKAGFDTIAAHITAILFPLLLNLFLWLGPRLHVDDLFNLVMDDAISIWKTGGASAEEIQQILDWYQKTIPATNLFWLLRTFPIGVSSLLFPRTESATPFGVPSILQVNAFSLFGWIILLTVIGWVGGGLYFRSVAQISVENKDEKPVGILYAIVQTMIISIIWGVLIFMIGVPLFLILGLFLQFIPFLANILVLVISLASMWVIVPLFFWPIGMFIKKQGVIASIMSSVQVARFTLPTSSLFVLTVFLLTFGLNFLWSIPPEDSWMTVVGIFGHSFVATALLAGSFIYYRDMTNWLRSVINKLRPGSVPGKS